MYVCMYALYDVCRFPRPGRPQRFPRVYRLNMEREQDMDMDMDGDMHGAMGGAKDGDMDGPPLLLKLSFPLVS